MTDQKLTYAKYPVVAKVIDDFKVVVNIGSRQSDIKPNQRFVLFSVDPQEILDPVTGISLGHLEMVKGTGRIVHIQDRMCTLESDKTSKAPRTIIRRPLKSFQQFLGEEETKEHEVLPFENPQVGDYVKPI